MKPKSIEDLFLFLKKPIIKTIDIKYVFETRKSYTKFRKEWFEIKTLRKYMDEGNLDELVRNSPKQQRLIKIGKYWK